ncbi:MAG: hypothetical protein GY793_01560 [Proteobacteria bacterium]|nr:hypothetical protein [Pseudomonadota bacterium]
MTAKELLEDEKFGYDHFTKLTSTGINPDEDNIAQFAEDYHQAKLKLLNIDDVSNQRELLIAFIESHHEKHHYSYPVSEIDVNEYLSNL